jgi:hypothetical protein
LTMNPDIKQVSVSDVPGGTTAEAFIAQRAEYERTAADLREKLGLPNNSGHLRTTAGRT